MRLALSFQIAGVRDMHCRLAYISLNRVIMRSITVKQCENGPSDALIDCTVCLLSDAFQSYAESEWGQERLLFDLVLGDRPVCQSARGVRSTGAKRLLHVRVNARCFN